LCCGCGGYGADLGHRHPHACDLPGERPATASVDDDEGVTAGFPVAAPAVCRRAGVKPCDGELNVVIGAVVVIAAKDDTSAIDCKDASVWIVPHEFVRLTRSRFGIREVSHYEKHLAEVRKILGQCVGHGFSP